MGGSLDFYEQNLDFDKGYHSKLYLKGNILNRIKLNFT